MKKAKPIGGEGVKKKFVSVSLESKAESTVRWVSDKISTIVRIWPSAVIESPILSSSVKAISPFTVVHLHEIVPVPVFEYVKFVSVSSGLKAESTISSVSDLI